MNLYDLVRRWPYTTAWIAYVVYLAALFYLVELTR